MKERFIITIEFFRKLLTEKDAQNANTAGQVSRTNIQEFT